MLKTKEIEGIQPSSKILILITAMLLMLLLEELIPAKVILIKQTQLLLTVPRIINFKTDNLLTKIH